jgi:hypothetical protein
MNNVSGILGIAVGRIAAARRRRDLEHATQGLSDHELRDIGLRRDSRGRLEPSPPGYLR